MEYSHPSSQMMPHSPQVGKEVIHRHSHSRVALFQLPFIFAAEYESPTAESKQCLSLYPSGSKVFLVLKVHLPAPTWLTTVIAVANTVPPAPANAQKTIRQIPQDKREEYSRSPPVISFPS